MLKTKTIFKKTLSYKQQDCEDKGHGCGCECGGGRGCRQKWNT